MLNLLEVEISTYILSAHATVWAKMIQYEGIIGI